MCMYMSIVHALYSRGFSYAVLLGKYPSNNCAGTVVWRVHRQNVEVTNAEWTKRRTTKRRMGQNAECQNVE
jgi:hypothetical protein